MRSPDSTARFLNLPHPLAVQIEWGAQNVAETADRHLRLAHRANSTVLGRIGFRSSAPGELPPLKGINANRDAGLLDVRHVQSEAGGRIYDIVFFGKYAVRLALEGNTANVVYAPETDPELLVDDIFEMALGGFIKSHGGILFHAASMSHAGRGLMLVSGSGTGKSSSCLACVLDGAELLGDDATLVFPAAGAPHLVPLAAELSVRLRSLRMHEDSGSVNLRPVSHRHLWRAAAGIPAPVPLRVVASLTTSGEAATRVRSVSPSAFLARHAECPPFQGLDRDGLADCVADLAANGVRFVVAEAGLAPGAVSEALLQCLADERQTTWEAARAIRTATVDQARISVRQFWEKRDCASAVVPLLAHPVQSLAKSASVALALAPAAHVEPIPWDNYGELGPLPREWAGDRWRDFASWHAGAVALAENLDPRFLAEEIDEWLRLMPVLYPFMRSSAVNGETRRVLDEGWRRVMDRKYQHQLMLHLTDSCQLRCRYCYADHLLHSPRPAMSLDIVGEMLDWAVGQGLGVVSLTGGEPTAHPSFPELVAMIRERGLAFYLASNLLATDRNRDALRHAGKVEVHICDPDDYSPAHLRIFEENMGWLCAEVQARTFRYNLWRHAEADWQWVLERVANSASGEILYAVPFPSSAGTNRYVEWEALPAFAGTVVRFVHVCKARGIRAVPAKPLPACMFSDAQLADLLEKGAVATTCEVGAAGCTRNLVVDGMRRVYPCVALGDASFPFRGQTLAEFSAESRKLVLRRYVNPARPECRKCPWWQWRLCGAGCLSYQ